MRCSNLKSINSSITLLPSLNDDVLFIVVLLLRIRRISLL